MKKRIIALLLLAVSVVLGACTSTPETTTAGSQTNHTTELTPPTESDPVTKIRLTINGNDLSAYKIVYADSVYDKSVLPQFTTEHDFFKLIADDLAKRIHKQTGVQLPVVRDTETDESEQEILVGPTNRSESDRLDEMDIYKTCVKVKNSKLIVGAGYDSTAYTGNKRESYCYASTYHSWDAVEADLAKKMAEGIAAFDFSSETDYSTTVDLITVACIGDSITEGAGSTQRDFHAYPAVLGRILWKDHLVINLGNSGKTMRDDLGNHYRGTTQHAALKRYAQKFDYALVMLGTNDSYFDRSWPDASDNKYLTSADNLVKDITARNEDVVVVVMNCPKYFGTNGSGSPRVRMLQNQLPKRFEAMGIKTSFYDMYSFTEEKVGKSNFPDQLHPNDTGHALMAQELSGVLQKLEEGSYTYILPEVDDGKPTAPPQGEIEEGAVNILGKDLSKVYPLASNAYTGWFMQGAPYVYMNLTVFEGYTVTNLEIPVSSVKKGDTLTVSVVKYNHPDIVETLQTYTLAADFAASAGWAAFDGLSIEVPAGYTLAFGSPADTLKPLYLPTKTEGYAFYGAGIGSKNPNATLAINVYGKKNGE
ncbi:MAG: SGNH/GDSL hydrolase family protein [Clostridia bacterium]|nr:SGNH/GDSL hydrolase family protein [Clostridia bacterium]